jgi:hypothetical protein
LNSEEKIQELNGLLKDQEKEIEILKLVNTKMISHSNTSKDLVGSDLKLGLENVLKDMKNGKYRKDLNLLESELEKIYQKLTPYQGNYNL